MYHRTTRIYRLALELVEIAHEVMDGFPAGYGFLKDQLRRASSSVPLTFSEGCGRRTCKDRRNFFDTSKASAYEVASILDVAHGFRVIDPALAEQGIARCDQIAGMLSKYR